MIFSASRIDRHLITSMSIDVAYDLVHAGAGISRRSTLSLPLKLDLELATKEKKLRMKWTPVASHEVYHYKHEPFTFIDSYVNLVPHIMEEGYFPVRRVSRHEVTVFFFLSLFVCVHLLNIKLNSSNSSAY